MAARGACPGGGTRAPDHYIGRATLRMRCYKVGGGTWRPPKRASDHGHREFDPYRLSHPGVSRATVHRAWAVAEQGQTQRAVELAREGIRLHREAGEEIWLPFFLSLVAEILGKDNQPRAGLDVLTEALEMVERRGEHFSVRRTVPDQGRTDLANGRGRDGRRRGPR